MEFIDEENNTFTDRFSRESSASQCFYMFEGRHASVCIYFLSIIILFYFYVK